MSATIPSNAANLNELLLKTITQFEKIIAIDNSVNSDSVIKYSIDTLDTLYNYLLMANWELTSNEVSSELHSLLEDILTILNSSIITDEEDSRIDFDQLQSVSQHTDAIIKIVYKIPLLTISSKNEIKSRIKSLRSSIDRCMENLASKTTEIISDLKTKHSEYEDEFYSQKIEIENKLNQLNTDLDQKYDNALEVFQTKIANEQAKTSKILQDSVNTIVQGMKEKNIYSAEIITTLNARLEEANKLLQTITNTSMSGAYQHYADEEKKLAQKWQYYTIDSLIITFISFLVFYFFGKPINNYFDLLQRGFISLTLMSSIVYCGYQAYNYRKASVCYRQLQMELASISPYFSELKPESRAEIMRVLSPLYFKGVPDDALKQEHGLAMLTAKETLSKMTNTNNSKTVASPAEIVQEIDKIDT